MVMITIMLSELALLMPFMPIIVSAVSPSRLGGRSKQHGWPSFLKHQSTYVEKMWTLRNPEKDLV